jgi:hypothetical protein
MVMLLTYVKKNPKKDLVFFGVFFTNKEFITFYENDILTFYVTCLFLSSIFYSVNNLRKSVKFFWKTRVNLIVTGFDGIVFVLGE